MEKLGGDAMAILLETNPEPDNYYASLVTGQRFAVIPAFGLESGDTLLQCPIAYKTWGSLNKSCDNVLVICHALTGSADVSDWWKPLLGAGRAFDPTRFFIFCANVLGSPYGSASPLTRDPRAAYGRHYGASFPPTTPRDDARAQKVVLDALGVRSVAAVIGGSMGGMTALEWVLCAPPGYVRDLIPIATAADHSAWGISWAETQRQCIYSDPKFAEGDYEPTPEGQPAAGLSAARMIAMLTYRSCASFNSRFGRRLQHVHNMRANLPAAATEPPLDLPRTDAPSSGVKRRYLSGSHSHPRKSPSFMAQGYLFYQGEKFVQRFDANCYLHLTAKMDSHDVMRGRADRGVMQEGKEEGEHTQSLLKTILAYVPPRALVISVETDALFLPEQQERLAACLSDASLAVLRSSDGHDGFLLEFEQLDELIQQKLRREFPELYNASTFAHGGEGQTREREERKGTGPYLTRELEEW